MRWKPEEGMTHLSEKLNLYILNRSSPGKKEVVVVIDLGYNTEKKK